VSSGNGASVPLACSGNFGPKSSESTLSPLRNSNVPQSPTPDLPGLNSAVGSPAFWSWQLSSFPIQMLLSGPADWMSVDGVGL
jgi:hypothetical protein